MKRHKWVNSNPHRKSPMCIKCGVYRDWQGGDMQCWEYWHPDYTANQKIINHKFTRPDCVVNRPANPEL